MTKYLQFQTARYVVDLNRFADALADGLTVNEAAARIGRSEPACRNYLVAIRRQLGPQAV